MMARFSPDMGFPAAGALVLRRRSMVSTDMYKQAHTYMPRGRGPFSFWMHFEYRTCKLPVLPDYMTT